MSKEFKDFMCGKSIFGIIGAAFSLFFTVVFIINAVFIQGGEPELLIVAFFFLLVAFLALIPAFKSRKFIKELKESGLEEAVEVDFRSAVSNSNDRVRFGKEWMFAKWSIKLIRYSEIKQVYQLIIRKNGVENERRVQYVDTAGKEHKICRIKRFGKGDGEFMEIVELIVAKNPNVKVGYES
ncbi:MAG: hypothetical protein IJO09_05725 [Oscillospiraceae bacterium]|nr:hypothetical protein [Oscillospiraceae bacterium]